METEARAAAIFADLVAELEQCLGARRINFDAVDFMQWEDGPALKVTEANATVFVGPNATKYEPTLVANLAHESVHLLDATVGGASRLEEGVAVHFELAVIGRRYGADEVKNFEQCLPQSYARALRDYRVLLSLDSGAVRRVRQEFGSLTGPTAAQLRTTIPGLGRWLSYQLARRMRMRP